MGMSHPIEMKACHQKVFNFVVYMYGKLERGSGVELESSHFGVRRFWFLAPYLSAKILVKWVELAT